MHSSLKMQAECTLLILILNSLKMSHLFICQLDSPSAGDSVGLQSYEKIHRVMHVVVGVGSS